jgi:hypothetical protein
MDQQSHAGTEWLKTGAHRPGEKSHLRRAESRRRYALARPYLQRIRPWDWPRRRPCEVGFSALPDICRSHSENLFQYRGPNHLSNRPRFARLVSFWQQI